MKEKVWFANSKGDRLCGILSDVGKTAPITVLCHGFASSKDRKFFVKMEKSLNKNKISTFRFDFFGHGESEGRFEDITVSEAVDDILLAINFLKVKGFKKIGVLGSSFGGISSLMAASKTKDIFFLVLRSPVSNYTEQKVHDMGWKELDRWKNEGYTYYETGDGRKLKLNYGFFQDFEKNNGYKAARKIKIPTLIIHGDKDESVPVKQSIKSAKLIKGCRLEIIRGADHRYTDPKHFKKMYKLVTEFIINNCKKHG